MKKLNTMDKILLAIAVFLVLYTITILVMFWFKGYEPSVLTGCVFGVATSECGFMSLIKSSKIKHENSKWE